MALVDWGEDDYWEDIDPRFKVHKHAFQARMHLFDDKVGADRSLCNKSAVRRTVEGKPFKPRTYDVKILRSKPLCEHCRKAYQKWEREGYHGIRYFKIQGGHNVFHLFQYGDRKSMCGRKDVPWTVRGRCSLRRTHRFHELDQKPRSKWCGHCLKRYEKDD